MDEETPLEAHQRLIEEAKRYKRKHPVSGEVFAYSSTEEDEEEAQREQEQERLRQELDQITDEFLTSLAEEDVKEQRAELREREQPLREEIFGNREPATVDEDEDEEVSIKRIDKEQRKMRLSAYLRKHPQDIETVNQVKQEIKLHKGYVKYLQRWFPDVPLLSFEEWKKRKEEE